MKIIKYITLLILSLYILASCKDNVTSSIGYKYNKKTKVHSITFPEYNYISPQFFTIPIKNIEVNPSVFLSYKIDSKNMVYLIKFIVETDKNTIHEYNIYDPPINKEMTINVLPTDFTPKIDENSLKIAKVSISINGIGEGTSKDNVSLTILNEKDFTQTKKNVLKNDLLIPNSGHYAKSNPPFIYWNGSSNKTTLLLSKNNLFQENETIKYTIKNRNFFMPEKALSNGKWNMALVDNNLNTTNIYSFSIGKQSKNIGNIAKPTNQRPFIFLNTNRIDTLSFWYNYYKDGGVARNMLGRNMNALTDYVNKMSSTNTSINNLNIDDIPSYAVNFQLVSLFDTNQTFIIEKMKNIVSEISLLSITNNIEGYSEIELANILAIPLITSLNWHNDKFSAEKIIDIKMSLVNKGKILYKHFTENLHAYHDVKNTHYITTLALISMALYNESFEEERIRTWYDYSTGYINSLILTQIGSNGELSYNIQDSYDFLYPIIGYAVSLDNASDINLFTNSYLMNTAKYLTSVGFRGGYINPIGDNIANRYSMLKNEDFIETVVMEAMARIYGNPIYKKHANYGVNDAITNKYLPYMILFNSDDINIKNTRNNLDESPYVFSYFPDIETIIYNPSPFTNTDAYFIVHGKAKGISDRENSHNDSMSFLYYNYGDMFIDDGGFFGEKESDYYNFLKSSKAHSGISIDDKYILNHGASHSYIETYTNAQNYIYIKMKSSELYTYPLILDNYTRRFYYIKPDILVIKDNIKALANINNPKYAGKYFYTWRFSTRLDVAVNENMNMFSIFGKNAMANVYFINDDKLKYSIENDSSIKPKDSTYDNIPQLNIAQATTESRVKEFSPWVLIITEKYNKTKKLEILEVSEEMISFMVDNKQYTINYSGGSTTLK